MKLKGIKPVEQHVEKAVLGVCGVAFVGALVWQLFLTQSEVKVGSTSKPIAAAFDPAKEEAKKLASLAGSTDPKLPEVPKLALRDTLRLGTELPSTKGKAFALGAGPGVRVGETEVKANAAVLLPQVPAPKGVVAAAYRNTFSPVEKLRTPALAALLPAEQPLDKASVSIEGVFDGVAFKGMLESDPDGPSGPAAPVPLNWWRDPAGLPAVEIVSVEVERKTIRNPDGTTPEQEVIVLVPSPPGRTGLPAAETSTLVAMWEKDARSAGDIPPMLDELRQIGPMITRPEFYETIAGPEWERPSEVTIATGDDDTSRQLRSTKRQIATIDRQITEIEGRMGGPRGGARGRESDRQSPGSSGSSGRGRGGGGGRGGERGVTPPQEVNESQKKALEENLKRIQAQRETLAKKLESLGGKDDGPMEGPEVDEIPWLDNDKVEAWSHDLTVQPGAVYQYRMRFVINNPVFGRALQEEQKQLAEQKLLRGTWSEWTAPVTIDRDREFFVLSATDANPVTGRPNATAEVFVFYYGYYRSQGGSFEPGDRLNLRVNLPDELKLADMKALEEAFQKGQIPGLSPMTAPTGLDSRQGPGGGKGGPGPAPAPSPDRTRDDRRGGNQQVTASSLMSVVGPKFVAVGVDSVLLGVRGVPGEGTTRYQAVVRDVAQKVVAMAPEDIRGSASYQRLKASVKAGEEILKPKVMEETKPTDRPSESCLLYTSPSPRD